MKAKYPNVFKHLRAVFLGCCLMFPFLAYAAPEQLIYRYKNEKGEKVFNSHIPKKFVSGGYQVINIFGDLIEDVPAALTEEEKALKAAEDQALFDQQETVRLKAEADKKLLHKYSEPADAERARDRQLQTVDVYIGITLGNIKRLQAEMAIENEKAADVERSGADVGKDSLEEISRIKNQIEKAELFIKEKRQEKNDISQAFGLDIQRLIELKPTVTEK